MMEYEQLKPREIEILRLMSDDLTNREIGERLYLGVETVRWYARQIYSKLAVSGRDEAVEKAKLLQLLDEAPASEQPKAVLKHNLPTQLTPFIGRTNELSELAQLLQTDEVRLVTIAAQGGMGKSRLAWECARQHLTAFTDGVYFVALTPLHEAESIVQALIDAVRCPYVPNEQRTRTQQLLEYLSDKHMLLIMDNFEHLIAEAGIVTEILSAASSVRILVTSRQRLNQSNEHIVQLEPMPYPGWETPEDALEYDAFQLFVQSARRIHADFELTKDNLDSVTRICQGVQGLPLGIVLAASWLSLLSPQEIVEEMRQSFDFLETEMSDIPARLRSIRQVFDYSWRLMTTKEQQILMALSVFRGGFTREAAGDVCAAGLRDLMGLMNKSLISRDTATGRYSIHELLRQYAAEQLQKAGYEETVFDAHKNYFAQWMKAREGEITYRRQQAALDDIEIDFENVRLAWERAIEQRDCDRLNQMVEVLQHFTKMRIRHDDGYKMLQAALAITPTTERLHYRLIFRLVRLALVGGLGEYETNLSLLRFAIAQAEFQKDDEELGFGIYIEAALLAVSEETQEKWEKALVLLPPNSFYRSYVMVRYASYIAERDFERGVALLHEALALQRERGDVNELAGTIVYLIRLLRRYLRFSEAEQQIEEALYHSRFIRLPYAESLILFQVAIMAWHKGDFENAKEIVERSYHLGGQQTERQMRATLLKLQLQSLLNEPVSATLSELASIINKAKGHHPWYEKVFDNTIQGAIIHSLRREDAAARRAWQADIVNASPEDWSTTFALEVVAHTSAGQDEFAATLVGHLATYGDDVVGWLKRWSRYQDALLQLQSRLDEAAYKAAFARGQSLTLDQMVQELKTNTGAS